MTQRFQIPSQRATIYVEGNNVFFDSGSALVAISVSDIDQVLRILEAVLDSERYDY